MQQQNHPAEHTLLSINDGNSFGDHALYADSCIQFPSASYIYVYILYIYICMYVQEIEPKLQNHIDENLKSWIPWHTLQLAISSRILSGRLCNYIITYTYVAICKKLQTSGLVTSFLAPTFMYSKTFEGENFWGFAVFYSTMNVYNEQSTSNRHSLLKQAATVKVFP